MFNTNKTFDLHGQFLCGLGSSNSTSWPHMDLSEIPSGVVEVSMIIEEGGREYDSVLIAGHMATEVRRKDTLVPSLGWAIALKGERIL